MTCHRYFAEFFIVAHRTYMLFVARCQARSRNDAYPLPECVTARSAAFKYKRCVIRVRSAFARIEIPCRIYTIRRKCKRILVYGLDIKCMIFFIDFCLTVLTKIIVSGKIGIMQFTVTLVFNLISQRETCQSLILSACRRIRISGSVCYNDKIFCISSCG